MTSARDGLARSVQVRLARHAKAIGVDPNLVLTRYGVERCCTPFTIPILDAHTNVYTMTAMHFSWSEAKRARNLKDHGIDFADAEQVFRDVTYTFEDDRFAYGEQRFVTLGLLAGIPVSIVHMESEHEIRIISFRKATKRETEIYFRSIQD